MDCAWLAHHELSAKGEGRAGGKRGGEADEGGGGGRGWDHHHAKGNSGHQPSMRPDMIDLGKEVIIILVRNKRRRILCFSINREYR